VLIISIFSHYILQKWAFSALNFVRFFKIFDRLKFRGKGTVAPFQMPLATMPMSAKADKKTWSAHFLTYV